MGREVSLKDIVKMIREFAEENPDAEIAFETRYGVLSANMSECAIYDGHYNTLTFEAYVSADDDEYTV